MSTLQPDYFRDAARVRALVRECQSWDGTPFRQQSAVKGPGGGVDCVSFISRVLLAIGAIDVAISVPPYPINHAEHSDESLLKNWFCQPEVRARVRRLEEDEAHLDGDFVFPTVGRAEHHIAFRVGDDLYSVARPSGYCVFRMTQVKLHASRYRIMEAAA